MFLVRVFLFLMSRCADDAGPISVVDTSVPVDPDHRPTSHQAYAHIADKTLKTKNAPRVAGNGDASDSVTREELVKLFGGALRVR